MPRNYQPKDVIHQGQSRTADQKPFINSPTETPPLFVQNPK